MNMTTEQKTEIVEMMNEVIETMTGYIETMEQALAAPVLRGQNTLLVTEDGLSAVTTQDDKYILRSVPQAAFFSPKGAAQVAEVWNVNHTEIKIKPVNWRDAYTRQIERYKSYIEDYKVRLVNFQ